MFLPISKKIFFFILLVSPLSIGIVSCANNNETNEEISTNYIPPITAVAALGQLIPSGEIRELAAPTTQFGNSPRITKLLVSEGDFVKKGEILAVFENSEKLISNLQKTNKIIKTIDQEILLKNPEDLQVFLVILIQDILLDVVQQY